ncbi:MAG: GH32 C-terminal domain-containing protein [Verrucomicrobia bacterium]|nr:GH32 C-terminal domain-containing protein [Verrucomicrobiota bacterium]
MNARFRITSIILLACCCVPPITANAVAGLKPRGTVELTHQAGQVANDEGHNSTRKERSETASAGSAAASSQLCDEAFRPQFHFTYQKGWLSDINGLFYCEGEYHFFSQHNPAGPGLDYGNIHWGHAVSKDLIHWTELPPALSPDKDGPIFSGSAVVDWKNTSGLQTGKEPVLVAFYTAARYMFPAKGDGVQSMAYSNDRGRTWTKYAGNPVLPPITHYNRDPKVFWHEPTRKWVMVITLSCADNWLLGRDGDYRFGFFSSADLKQWKELSRFDMPRGLDCCGMFELPVDGKADNRRWVLWAGDGTHAIGAFDGTRFVPTGGIHLPLLTWEEKGANGYAAQTFSDIPAADGRRIQIAWLRALEHGGYPGMPFNQQALFPVELTLRTVDGRIQLFREPVREVDQLHGRKWEWTQHALRPGENLLSGIRGELFELRTAIEPGDASEISFRVRGATLRYDPTRKTLTCLDKTVPAGSADGKLRLQLLIDRTTLEIFADRGRTSLSFFLAPGPHETPLELKATGGEAKVQSLSVWEMKSIWPHSEKPAAAAHPVPPTISLANSPFIFGAGGVDNSMDAMAFFHQGVWHLFHMQTRPRGIAHRVSRDLVNWEIRPLAIPGDAATGNVVAQQGQFHLFYTLNQTVHLATSDNLDDWTPCPRNPVATVDGKQYVGSNFRDPYVFYNEKESCWWMLVAAEVPGPIPFRAGCVGVYKSPNLLDWRAAEPLWAPGLGPRHECPQVIREKGRWYLFDIERQDQYRVAKSLTGPWLRPASPYLGPHTALAGSHLTSDGKRWVSFPFLCAQQGKDDFGEVVQAEVYAIPRQLDFHADDSITERPIQELIQAMHALAPVPPLTKTTTLSGSWDLKEHAAISEHTGTLLLNNVPSDCYFEADVTLGTRQMEAAILLRVDAALTRGYRLELRPEEGIVALRPFSFWDRDRILVSGRIDLPTGSPFKIRIFLSGTVVETFIADRLALSSRVYRHPEGHVALAVNDGAATFRNLVVRRLCGDNHEADGRRP